MGVFTIRELAEELAVTYTLEKPEAVNERLMKSLRDGAYPVLIGLEKELFRKTVLHAAVPRTWTLLSRALSEAKTLEEETGILLLVCRELEKCREKGLEVRNLELQPERMYLTEDGSLRMFFWPIVNRRESVSAGLFFSSLPLSTVLSSPEDKAFETEYTRLLKNPEQVTSVMVERFIRDFTARRKEAETAVPVAAPGVRQQAAYDPFGGSGQPKWPETPAAPVSPLNLDQPEEEETEAGGTSVLGIGDFFSAKAPAVPLQQKTEPAPGAPPILNTPTPPLWQTDAAPMESPLEQADTVSEEEAEVGGTSVLGLGEAFPSAKKSAVPEAPAWPPAPPVPAWPPAPEAPAAPSWPPASTAASPMEAAGMPMAADQEEEAPTALLQEDSLLIRKSTGERIVLTGDVFSVGKRETCSYVVRDNRYVSHLHAELRRTPNGWVIRDKGAANRTRIDGRVLTPETDERLQDGCCIRLANEEFQFVAGE